MKRDIEKEEAIYDEAIKCLELYCKENMVVFQQPSKDLSLVGRKYVHLSNSNGSIAVYVIKEKRVLSPDLTLLR